MVITAEHFVVLKEVEILMSDLDIIINLLVNDYKKRSTPKIESKDTKLVEQVIKNVDSILEYLELLPKPVQTRLTRLQPKFNDEPLYLIKAIFANAKEVFPLIKNSSEEEILNFAMMLTRIKDIVFLQTNNQTWDWAISKEYQRV